jgi:acetoin utilization deacetylase AcuC-like enzyme
VRQSILLYYNPIFLKHETGEHPENAARLLPAVRHLHALSLNMGYGRPDWKPATLERIEGVHTTKHINAIRSFAEAGGGRIEVDTVVGSDSYEVAMMAAGAVCDAVERVHRDESQTAFCLLRPPGHHAMPDHAMGFCLFNNVAVGARLATTELGYERVLIIDWDVHHGNGTQAIFWEDPQVAYFSTHRDPFYPFTGAASETGTGAGLGTTKNLPIRFGTPREKQLDIFEQELMTFSDAFQPQLVLISAGFDAHKLDPIGSLGLEAEDFATMTRIVVAIADKHAAGKIVSVLEGGYNPVALAECIEQHLHELGGR